MKFQVMIMICVIARMHGAVLSVLGSTALYHWSKELLLLE